MIITIDNYKTIDTAPAVLAYVLECLERGDSLVVSNELKGEYVCTCNLGVVQRLIK